jgi:hypothetical protein
MPETGNSGHSVYLGNENHRRLWIVEEKKRNESGKAK